MAQPLLTKEAREALNYSTKRWFETELDIELGQFECEAVIDYFIEALKPAAHNRAIAQALAMVQEHHARMEDDLYALEEPEV
ncbi:DUF2164 domain-containing protein [Saccharospirillum impatiens]|uniref:DUF2164 domain-containing protein n=1 Tax=Saccharospirillum impatiens TaxID=169438 RepID=UPI00041B0129|nr:DUF2164 family protein [Saccharospirillum impatiens]